MLSKIKPHFDAAHYFKKFPFYNKPIQKPKLKPLKSIEWLVELPFYEQQTVIETDQAFRGHAMWKKCWNNWEKRSNCRIRSKYIKY